MAAAVDMVDVVARLRDIRVPRDRREAIERWMEGEHTLTDVLMVADPGMRTELTEALTGVKRIGRTPQHRHEWQSRALYRMRTLDGEPARCKLGLREYDARGLRRLSMMGETPDICVDVRDGAEVDAHTGLLLLLRHGFGIVRRSYWRRNAVATGEKDAAGNLVTPIDRWRVVEVGSQMEARAIEAGDIKPTRRAAKGGG